MSEKSIAAFIGFDQIIKLVLPDSPHPETLIWHYTRKPVADSIIETGIFRASHYADFVDKSEVQFGVQQLRLALARSLNKTRNSREARNWVRDLVEHQTYHLFQLPHYALCASQTSNSSYLWKNYAKHDGRAIGIPCAEAARIAVVDSKANCENVAYNFVSWQNIVYGSLAVGQFADRVINCLFEIFPDEQAAASILLYFIPFVKKPEFRNEQEVRLLVSQTGPSQNTAERIEGGRRFVKLSYANSIVSLTPRQVARPGGPEYQGKIQTEAKPLPRLSICIYPGLRIIEDAAET